MQVKNKCVNLETDILIGSSRIELVRSAKTLGVFFDSHISWTDHISRLPCEKTCASHWNTDQVKTAATQCQSSLIQLSLPVSHTLLLSGVGYDVYYQHKSIIAASTKGNSYYLKCSIRCSYCHYLQKFEIRLHSL